MITSFSGVYRFLSNFWPCSIGYYGIVYPSVENAYQALKCVDPEDRRRFVDATPGLAKSLGKTVELRPDWDLVKLFFMRELVAQKFRNDEDLKVRLKNTGDQELVEGNTWGDKFWGVCKGQGQNHLGKILMEVRKNLDNV